MTNKQEEYEKLDRATIKLIRLIQTKCDGDVERAFGEVVKSKDPYMAIVYGYMVGVLSTTADPFMSVAFTNTVKLVMNMVEEDKSDDEIIEELNKIRRRWSEDYFRTYGAWT